MVLLVGTGTTAGRNFTASDDPVAVLTTALHVPWLHEGVSGGNPAAQAAAGQRMSGRERAVVSERVERAAGSGRRQTEAREGAAGCACAGSDRK